MSMSSLKSYKANHVTMLDQEEAESTDFQTATTSTNIHRGSYWLTRIIHLRCLGLLYSVAFFIALHQNRQLVGNAGLLPANLYLKDVAERIGAKNKIELLFNLPTLLWLVDWSRIDWVLDAIAYTGIAVSFVIVVTGAANIIALTLLWILYHSIVNVGQRWYSFGWESQLLEIGFLSIWFCPLLTWKQLPSGPPSRWVVFGFRWLIFRCMFGSGMIKIRGDSCWRDLTCMDYHYETQPLPNPMAYWMYHSPKFFHQLEVMVNHFAELVCPWLVLLPFRPLVMFGGVVQTLFQGLIIFSGNYSILNWECILPCVCCIDDAVFYGLFPATTRRKLNNLANARNGISEVSFGQKLRKLIHVCVFGLIAYLSIPVVQNIFSASQVMNTSFEPFRIVNTYGAFGSITKERNEIIMQGTSSDDPYGDSAIWLEYEFKCKPGNLTRRPCTINPYHYRLDWLMWFAAFENYQRNPWLFHLVAKMLKNDAFISELIAFNPFLGNAPPKYIKLDLYRYRFSKPGSAAATKGQWWTRRRVRPYLEPISYENVRPILKRFEWPID